MHPWQQIGLEDAASVRAMNSYRQGGPVFGLTHQGSVPLTPSDPIVCAKNLATLCTPSTPKVWQLLVGSTNEPIKASSGASLPRRLCVPSACVRALSLPSPLSCRSSQNAVSLKKSTTEAGSRCGARALPPRPLSAPSALPSIPSSSRLPSLSLPPWGERDNF